MKATTIREDHVLTPDEQGLVVVRVGATLTLPEPDTAKGIEYLIRNDMPGITAIIRDSSGAVITKVIGTSGVAQVTNDGLRWFKKTSNRLKGNSDWAAYLKVFSRDMDFKKIKHNSNADFQIICVPPGLESALINVGFSIDGQGDAAKLYVSGIWAKKYKDYRFWFIRVNNAGSVSEKDLTCQIQELLYLPNWGGRLFA